MPQATVVALCGDPGGGNAVAPLIEALRAEGRVNVKAWAYAETRDLWAKRSLAYDRLAGTMTAGEASILLRECRARLLLVGTSVNSLNLEKVFIQGAREAGIPSVAVLDYWSNYSARFSDNAGHLSYLPDRIAVMDERAREEMIAEGFAPERLVVTGQPALDELVQEAGRYTPAVRAEIRRGLGVQAAEQLLVFVSQPLSRLYGDNPAVPGHLGFTERTVLVMLMAALHRLRVSEEHRIVLAVRPHPREDTEGFATLQSGCIRVLVSREGTSRDLIAAADIVIGMNSMLLVEACYLGRPTVSLQPGLRLPDTLPTNRSGHSIPVYRAEELEPIMARLVDGHTDDCVRPGMQAALVAGAIQRMVGLVYDMIGLDRRR